MSPISHNPCPACLPPLEPAGQVSVNSRREYRLFSFNALQSTIIDDKCDSPGLCRDSLARSTTGKETGLPNSFPGSSLNGLRASIRVIQANRDASFGDQIDLPVVLSLHPEDVTRAKAYIPAVGSQYSQITRGVVNGPVFVNHEFISAVPPYMCNRRCRLDGCDGFVQPTVDYALLTTMLVLVPPNPNALAMA
jgi:hypothetical protein